MSRGLSRVKKWFAARGREPFQFQLDAWQAYLDGKSGLIQAPTGMGKTLAAALGPAIEFLDANSKSRKAPPLTMLWITPLRALASDTLAALADAGIALELNWNVELRTSDTTASVRRRQKIKLPSVLVTTPESLSLLLSYPDAPERFASVNSVVVDEWHELMGSKRGVQTELSLARLRTFQPKLRTWGVSATIANADEALSTLVGHQAARDAVQIRGPKEKEITLASVLPPSIERFPWAGHIGTKLLGAVVDKIDAAGSTLIFTNTRSQSEIWFAKLLESQPHLIGQLAIHHGSLDRKIRSQVENLLRDGQLKAVVCTSSLDLGVDFWPVDQVIQIGSPKSVARAMQRAGRSGHRPGAISKILCVPTQAFELVEFSATRFAMEHRNIEPREPIRLALDVLAQHLVTIAAGGGFEETQMFAEVKSTHAYEQMTPLQWQWVMDFVERGGPSLVAYPRFARIRRDENNRWTVVTDQLARMHRMSIGTITADGSVSVKILRGRTLGAVEESFAAKLRPGDTFSFAGRALEFVRMYEMSAIVRAAKSKKGIVPRWMGGRFPLSSSLAAAVRMRLTQAADGEFVDEEMQKMLPILRLQKNWSQIPRADEILIETIKSRDGYHHFLFPFQGRLVHEGLGALLSLRLGRRGMSPITATFNDYGLELLCPFPMPLEEKDWFELLQPENLTEDVLTCVNSGQLSRRQFRDIARIAGLLVPTRPGAQRSTRQLQASAELFFDVFQEFDPENLLLEQARREVLERQLEFKRLQSALEKIAKEKFLQVEPVKMSPLAFPLWAERIGSQQLRSESAASRIERFAKQLEAAAGEDEEMKNEPE